MNVLLHSSAAAPWQQLTHERLGTPVQPPFEFRCRLSATHLILSARRAAPARFHPQARPGQFQECLWKYDTAEFFIATAGGDCYLELNLAPNGAWWSAAFAAPRVVNPALPARPEGILARGQANAHGWEAELQLPLTYLHLMGIPLGEHHKPPFRLAATAILGSPEPLYLSTATDTSGRPDFHRPYAWGMAAYPSED